MKITMLLNKMQGKLLVGERSQVLGNTEHWVLGWHSDEAAPAYFSAILLCCLSSYTSAQALDNVTCTSANRRLSLAGT